MHMVGEDRPPEALPDVRARRLPRLLGMVPGVAGVVGLQLLPLFFTTVWRETENRK